MLLIDTITKTEFTPFFWSNTLMRTSNYLLATVREIPNDAEIISHQLMLRAGLIRKLASGLYSWLPTGVRVLRKVEKIVREEMNATGAIECIMPVVQPAELWKESGRWQEYGPELLRFKDRHQREFCLGPTHEEIITDIVRNEINSYKQLPKVLYQIQYKFRDEIRPRFGVMRGREFLMKDAYSFHLSSDSLQQTYATMYQAYSNIFNRIGLKFRAVLADTGTIGGSASHEFHVLAESGEDAIVFSNQSDYAANIEKATALITDKQPHVGQKARVEVATPDVHSIDEVCELFKVTPNQTIKTLIVKGANNDLVALVIRGDDALNEVKSAHLEAVLSPLEFASDEEIQQQLGCLPGSIGPVALTIPVIVDELAAATNNFVCGANKNGFHFNYANWNEDIKVTQITDIRNVKQGDLSPDGVGTLEIKRGIEVGHIFQLGDKYSKALNATVLNENGKATVMTMGCYGIGVSRTVAAAIEQNYDDKGIIWPEAIAPFHLAIVPINYHRSERVRQACEELYNACTKVGIEVILDDRNERPGVMFNDMELLGIPHRFALGERALDKAQIEYKGRTDEQSSDIPLTDAVSFIKEKLAAIL